MLLFSFCRYHGRKNLPYTEIRHAILFWIGSAFDIFGTLAMHKMAEGKFELLEPQTLSGQIALWLMFAHAIWATIVVRNGIKPMLVKFHRYSLFVWLVWLIPYFGGMYPAMSHR